MPQAYDTFILNIVDITDPPIDPDIVVGTFVDPDPGQKLRELRKPLGGFPTADSRRTNYAFEYKLGSPRAHRFIPVSWPTKPSGATDPVTSYSPFTPNWHRQVGSQRVFYGPSEWITDGSLNVRVAADQDDGDYTGRVGIDNG